MKKIQFDFLIIILFLYVNLNSTLGQSRVQDSMACEKAVSALVKQYNQTVGSQSVIYNGSDYLFERIKIGHAFFRHSKPCQW